MIKLGKAVVKKLPKGWELVSKTGATGTVAGDPAVFTNKYKAEGKTQFGGTKELKPRALTAGEFTFELYDSTGTLLETVTNDADGKFTFSELTYVYNTYRHSGGYR